MHSRIAVAIFALSLTLCLQAQPKDEFQIEVDPGALSGAVHVNYFLSGGFGGYVDSMVVQPAAGDIFLPIFRDGKRATSLKAFVYSQGCELTKFTLDPLPSGPTRVRYQCRKLGTVRLKGIVTGFPRPSELIVEFWYLANWSHAFFGISDGMVPMLPIAKAVPDSDGRFVVDVPDFANDAVTASYKAQGEWWITAAGTTGMSDRRPLNLNPARRRGSSPGTLRIDLSYPEELQFSVQQAVASPAR